MLVEVILSLEIVVGTLNPGAGLAFWFTDNVGLSLATTYKNLLMIEDANGVPDAPSHFQHTAGLT
jgi:hypothetical protein